MKGGTPDLLEQAAELVGLAGDMMFLIRALAVWLIIMCVETVFGILRTIFLAPQVGDFQARQVGTLISSLLILGIAYLFVRWIGVVATGELIIVGMVWVALTLLFEVILGRVVLGLSWERLASDYNILRGGLMPFGLLVLMLSPLIAARIRGFNKPSRSAQ